MNLEVLDVLVSYPDALVQVLILDHLSVLLPEQSLLQLDGLPIRSHELLHLIL